MISKFFASATKLEVNVEVGTSTSNYKRNLEDDLQEMTEESPYKSSLTDIKNFDTNTSANEDKDFKTPKPINKGAFKIVRNKSGRSSRMKKPRDNKKCKQMVFTKIVNENFQGADVNPEHLQIAIALSRSLQDNIREKDKESDDPLTSTFPSTQQKAATLKQTLEQFGFKSSTSAVSVQRHRIPLEAKRKKSKCQYITPVLLIRTQADREKIISDKVAQILAQNPREHVISSNCSTDNEPLSTYLQKHWKHDCRIFRMSGFEIETFRNTNEYYVKPLNIPATKTQLGSLLKDWSKIPGRDVSPVRSHTNAGGTKAAENECQSTISSDEKLDIFEINLTAETAKHNSINSVILNVMPSNDKVDALSTTLKNNLTTNRSISPDLFSSDDDVTIVVSSKTPQPSHLTPPKNKFVQKPASPIHSSPNEDISEEFSESLLNITPTKKKMFSKDSDMVSKRKSGLNNVISPLGRSSSYPTISEASSTKNKYKFYDLSDEDVFENDNGICTFESFSKENEILTQNCVDLTQSYNEENDDDKNILMNLSNSVSEAQDAEHSSVDNVNQSCTAVKNISHLVLTSPPKTGISEIFQKAICFDDQNVMTDNSKTSYEVDRRNKSLNVTDYIYKMLNEEQQSVINISAQDEYAILESEVLLKHNLKANECKKIDLTQSSTGSSSPDHPTSSEADEILSTVKEKTSNSDADAAVSPIKEEGGEENVLKFKKHDSFQSSTSDDINLSQESIYISDEELNYSSVYSTPRNNQRKQITSHKSKLSYEFVGESDSEQNNVSGTVSNNFSNMNLDYTPKTSKNCWELNDSSHSKGSVNEINLPKSTNLSFVNNDRLNDTFNDNQTVLQHPRVKNLSKENTPTEAKFRKSLFDESKALNDSFNAVLENSANIQNSSTTTTTAEIQNTTPKGEMIIKTSNVTPMTNYTEMNTPKVAKELQKFGIKPLKRQRGIQILKHIYESTHPMVGQATQSLETSESDEDQKVIKRRKTDAKIKGIKTLSPKKGSSPKSKSPNDISCIEHEVEYVSEQSGNEEVDSIAKISKGNKKVKGTKIRSPKKGRNSKNECEIEYISEINDKHGVDEDSGVTRRKINAKVKGSKPSQSPKKSKSPKIKNSQADLDNEYEMEYQNEQYNSSYIGKAQQIEIVGNLVAENETMEDLIFERKQSSKILSCKLPLHIAWHNLVSSQPNLQKNILLYEPLQLEVLYMALKEQGFKYHMQDLLTFLDKKCITIRTNQNPSRRRQKKASPRKKS